MTASTIASPEFAQLRVDSVVAGEHYSAATSILESLVQRSPDNVGLATMLAAQLVQLSQLVPAPHDQRLYGHIVELLTPVETRPSRSGRVPDSRPCATATPVRIASAPPSLATIPRRSATTLYHYRQYVDREIVPVLGAIRLSKRSTLEIDALYTKLRKRGLAAATIRQIHAILRASLNQAERWGLIQRNVAKLASAPA